MENTLAKSLYGQESRDKGSGGPIHIYNGQSPSPERPQVESEE